MSGRRAHPDERLRAPCTRELVRRLLPFDHHIVWLQGRPAVLLTYPLLELDVDRAPEPIWCEASVTYAAGHPTAPAEIQAIARLLPWEPAVTGDRPGAER